MSATRKVGSRATSKKGALENRALASFQSSLQMIPAFRPFVGDLVNPTHNVADRLVAHPLLLSALEVAAFRGFSAFESGFKSIKTGATATAGAPSSSSTFTSSVYHPIVLKQDGATAAAGAPLSSSTSTSSVYHPIVLRQDGVPGAVSSGSPVAQSVMRQGIRKNPKSICEPGSYDWRLRQASNNAVRATSKREVSSICAAFNIDAAFLRGSLPNFKSLPNKTSKQSSKTLAASTASMEDVLKFFRICVRASQNLDEQRIANVSKQAGYVGLNAKEVWDRLNAQGFFGTLKKK
jgi:hypothetical protein